MIDKVRKWKWVQFWTQVLTRFGRNNGSLNAAGLAFFLLLSFAPMVLSGVAILSRVIAPQHAINEVHTIIDNLLPEGAARDETTHFLGNRTKALLNRLSSQGDLVSFLGLLILLWTSLQIFVSGATAMNVAFDVKENRGWLKLRAVAFCLLIAGGVLMLVSLVLTGAPDLPWIADMHLPKIAITLPLAAAAVVINAALFTVIYRFLPARNVTWKSAFAGGVAASVLFELAKQVLAVFLLRPKVTIYGGLTNLIVFILWIYYSMTILLLGCEVAAVQLARESGGGRLPVPKDDAAPSDR